MIFKRGAIVRGASWPATLFIKLQPQHSRVDEIRVVHVITPKVCYLPWSTPTLMKEYTKSVRSALFKWHKLPIPNICVMCVHRFRCNPTSNDIDQIIGMSICIQRSMQVRSFSRILSLSLAFEVMRNDFAFSRLVISLSPLWSDMFMISWTILLQVSVLYAQRFMISGCNTWRLSQSRCHTPKNTSNEPESWDPPPPTFRLLYN